MGDQREALLLAMSLVAHDEAHKHPSEVGREVLEMMEYTTRNAGLSITHAYVEASATASLSERNKDIISRRTSGAADSDRSLQRRNGRRGVAQPPLISGS